jgi:cell division septation protein DedD
VAVLAPREAEEMRDELVAAGLGDDLRRVVLRSGRTDRRADLQRVAVDADEWHRVRIGPLTDLDEVNRLRTRLRASGLEPLVIRVGD